MSTARPGCGLSALGRVVANVAGRDDEDDVFGDVRRVIAYPLEVARDQDQIERRFDGGGILEHIGEKLAEYLRLEGVEFVVFIEHALRQRHVAADEGVERVAQ